MPLFRQVRILAAALLVAHSNAQGTLPVQRINGPIWDGNGGPLLAGRVWAITPQPNQPTSISVPAGRTLTIDGAILKFDGTSLDVDGVVVIHNTSVLTSWSDDSVGGDSNGDGTSFGQPGGWSGITAFNTASVTMLDSELRFAGQVAHQGPPRPAFWCRGAGGTGDITHSKILASLGVGLDLENFAVWVQRSEVSGCEAVGSAPFWGIGRLANNTASANTLRDDWLFTWIDPVASTQWPLNTLTVAPGSTMTGTVFVPTIPVPAGKSLAFQGPLVVKSLAGTIRAENLTATGTVFTSREDDTRGADFDKTTPSVAAPGDWTGLDISPVLSNGGLDLQICEVLHAGRGTQQSVLVNGNAVTLTSCRIARGLGDALRVANATVRSIEFCQFEDCAGIAARGLRWLDVSHCEMNGAVGNLGGDYFEVAPSVTTVANVTIGPDNYPGPVLVVGAGQSWFRANAKLRLLPGTILKCEHPSTEIGVENTGQTDMRGHGARPVIMTSLRDDAIAGDTNKDGNQTLPAPGDYKGVFVNSTAGPSAIEQVWFHYADYSVSCRSTLADIGGIRVTRGLGALDIGAVHGNLLHDLCIEDSVGTGLAVDGLQTPFDIDHVTIVNAGQYGITKGPNRQHRLYNSIVWNCAFGPQAGFPPNHVHNCNGLFPGQNGNTAVDPQLDPATCAPMLGSPMLGGGNDALAPTRPRDARGNPRRLDNGNYDGNGTTGSDGGSEVGGVERAPFRADSTGEGRIGGTISVRVDGPGSYFSGLLIGLQDGTVFWPPFGNLLAGTGSIIVLGFNIGNAPFTLVLPNQPGLIGAEFALQGLGIPAQSAMLGSFTNDLTFRIH